MCLPFLKRTTWASQVVLGIRNPPTNAGHARDVGLIPGSGGSPREGNGPSLQYSYLENPMGRGAWIATVHGAAKTTALSRIKAPSIQPYLTFFILDVTSEVRASAYAFGRDTSKSTARAIQM